MSTYDAIVIGSGPNGLAAAIELAKNGVRVLVLEAAPEVGGGTRTAELTLPGFHHDYCSAVHPLGVLSPYLKTLPLEDHGLRWIYPEASVAHPLDGRPAVLLYRQLERTIEGLGNDAAAWQRMIQPLLKDPETLLSEILGPLRLPANPVQFMRFGLKALWPAEKLAHYLFRYEPAKALFAGLAAHSTLPLDKCFTSAIGIMFAVSANMTDWPVAAGGSAAISRAMTGYLLALGGSLETSWKVETLNDLPPAKVYLFDTDTRQLAGIAEPVLPATYLRRLRKFHYGPGIFKLDWALDGPIPWKDPRCLQASTVHIGGTLGEIAASERETWRGRHSKAPFIILCQQSQFDPSRAPQGKHTGYAYCHVPHGSATDMTAAIEDQVERFAPGFTDLILARSRTDAAALFQHNPNYIGGSISGGSSNFSQLFTRPVARLDPYSTPHPRLFICSASTPPGGGVHGMCGYYAARSALRRLDGLEAGHLR